jgi:UPF0176 protein
MIVSSFYKFFPLPHYKRLQIPLQNLCRSLQLRGTILIAQEGLNASVSGVSHNVQKLYRALNDDFGIAIDNSKEMPVEGHAFQRMKVRLKQEIIKMGVVGLDVNLRGTLIDSFEWDNILSDPDYVIIDTRNDYEVDLGTFKGAINPNIKSFQDFPAWFQHNHKDLSAKKIAMFCTGGIRCEKSTAYARKLGHSTVVHLKGGILKYQMDHAGAGPNWQGECFVFDNRWSVLGNDFGSTS